MGAVWWDDLPHLPPRHIHGSVVDATSNAAVLSLISSSSHLSLTKKIYECDGA